MFVLPKTSLNIQDYGDLDESGPSQTFDDLSHRLELSLNWLGVQMQPSYKRHFVPT